MKQKHIEQEALRLLKAVHPQHNIKHPENFEGWVDGDYHRLAEHVLRRLANAERRGRRKERDENWKRFTKRP